MSFLPQLCHLGPTNLEEGFQAVGTLWKWQAEYSAGFGQPSQDVTTHVEKKKNKNQTPTSQKPLVSL